MFWLSEWLEESAQSPFPGWNLTPSRPLSWPIYRRSKSCCVWPREVSERQSSCISHGSGCCSTVPTHYSFHGCKTHLVMKDYQTRAPSRFSDLPPELGLSLIARNFLPVSCQDHRIGDDVIPVTLWSTGTVLRSHQLDQEKVATSFNANV